jgi:cytochrome c oxidase subunit 2
MLELLGLPPQAATHAAEIDQMTAVVHWLMLILFVGWGAFFVFVLFRFRKSANPRASYTGAKGKFAKSTEIAVAIFEAVLLLVYAIPAWAVRVDAFPTEEEAVVVRVTAEQFAWNIHYPGADRQFGRRDIKLITPDNLIGLDRTDPNAKDDLVGINQLNLPVNRPALIHLSTKDVIHSFGSVEMRVKQDAVPGLEIPVWFIPSRVGDYELSCSQLCGLGHFRMKAFMSIQSEGDFQNWLAEQAKSLTP